jgi:adenosylcobinamide-GDP ribazoletransferase
MSRPFAAGATHEGSIMPPVIYETVAWLRRYSAIPFPPLPGESEAGALPDPARAAYAAPLAGAVIGAAAGLVIVIVAALGASSFVAASAGVLALIVITGGRAEAAVEGLASREAASTIRYGILAIAVAVLLKASALDALLIRDLWGVLFALAGACAVARAAAIGFSLLRPASPEAVPGGQSTLQWLAIAGLGLGIVTVLPFFGLGAAVAAIAAAAGAVALVSAFVPRGVDESDNFTATAELAAEIAFLVAVVAFTDNS